MLRLLVNVTNIRRTMFDPHKETLTRKALCAVAGWSLDTYGNLKKAGHLPFFETATDSRWLRISSVNALVAAGMTKLAEESSDFSEISWKNASRIAYDGRAAATCVLRNRYGKLSDAEAEDLLGSPWKDRSADLWCGYARTIDANGDEGGWTLPCGTLGVLMDEIQRRSGNKAETRILKIILLNYSEVLADAEARARALKITFPMLDEDDQD